MIKKIEENTYTGVQTYFKDEKTGAIFQRIVGGLAWPFGDRAGFIVIIGEARPAKPKQKPHFHVLDSRENFNPTELIKGALALGRRYCVTQFYGDTSNKPMRDFVNRSKLSFNFTDPPHIDDPEALNSYISMIRECTVPGKKRLHFDESRIGAKLLEIPSQKIRRVSKVADWPVLAALGALAAMIAWPHNPREQEEADALNAELWAYDD